MPIRMIAKELYQLIREVEAIEKKIQSAPPERLEALKEQLRRKKAERDHVRNLLEGKKG